MSDTRALVMFSGGMDSTICLAWALERYAHVETIGFDYGQRHKVELTQRLVVLDGIKAQFPHWSPRLGPDYVLNIATLGAISNTAVTRDVEMEMTAAGLPNTFVPGRNLLFATFAAALGYRREITTLVGGMCETDYSGYPDCRNNTLQVLARAISFGMDREFQIKTPLMWTDKAGTWIMARRLGGQRLVDLIIEDTHTCYLGDRTHRHEWGYGCNDCPACHLRANGWDEWQAVAKRMGR
jgi:7-cyano-7-deazaguanine synthase